MRECYSDVRVFSLVDKNWLLIKTFGDIIEGRRNHIAENLGKFLFVYGGINSYGRILNDVCGLNLETSKWYYNLKNIKGLITLLRILVSLVYQMQHQLHYSEVKLKWRIHILVMKSLKRKQDS